MSHLSFREQAAISIAGNDETEIGDCVELAQRLADEACDAWGHDYDPYREPECLRCGKRGASPKARP